MTGHIHDFAPTAAEVTRHLSFSSDAKAVLGRCNNRFSPVELRNVAAEFPASRFCSSFRRGQIKVRTDELIAVLSTQLRPVSRFAVERRVAIGLGVGAMLAFVHLALWLGVRPDLASAATSLSFWLKLAFNASIGMGAMALSCRLGRPACRSRAYWRALAAPVVLILTAGAVEIALTPSAERLHLWLGDTWWICPLRIVLLSGPTFIGMLWAFRRLAPTELRTAGFAAGLAAGGVGASVYALACQESSLAFVATWYSLGILAVASIGALVGPRVLRW